MEAILPYQPSNINTLSHFITYHIVCLRRLEKSLEEGGRVFVNYGCIIGDFLHRTFEHRPNQTLDIYVYNTTTYDEGTHLGRHIALNPLPFLTIKTTWQKDSFCPKTAKCWFKIRVTRITLQKRIQEYYDTTILVLFFPEFKRDKGYAS